MKWVFLGPPGAGKGTQAKRVTAEREDVTHLSTGDLLRSEVSASTDLGRKAKAFMDEGALVPDDLVIEMVVRRIGALDRYLLDGFPRTLPQARALDERTGSSGVDRVFYFDLTDEEIVARLSGRRTCAKFGAMYHVEFMPPAKDEICDRCGGELLQRDDDRPDAIRNRIAIARQQSGPLLDYYETKGLLVRVDASRSADEVFREVSAYLSA
jgi:adenylate kinase